MAFFNSNKPQIDIGKFIAETFKKTVSASRSRRVIFGIILFLQFLAFELVTYLFGHSYPDSYNGLQQKIADEAGLRTIVALIEYLLLLILVIMSPAERTRKRRIAKYIVLLGSLYFWIITDITSSAFNQSSQESELAAKSFKENSVPIYGKVVFASYKRDKLYGKRNVAIAEKVSAQTSGYIVIVQLDDSIYNYPGLKTLYHYFNDYAHDFYDTTFRTNIHEKMPDLSNCQQFIFDFSLSRKKIPDLPTVDKYVKIIYDPIKNGIAMYTDSATAATPIFDSIPHVNRQQRGD